MLYFIYCGKTKNLKDNGEELLKAADLCQLDNLKGIILTLLTKNLNRHCLLRRKFFYISPKNYVYVIMGI